MSFGITGAEDSSQATVISASEIEIVAKDPGAFWPLINRKLSVLGTVSPAIRGQGESGITLEDAVVFHE
jgi:hypothetical protein